MYHLNADFDHRQMLDFTRLDPDCVHTVGPPRPMPKQVTSPWYGVMEIGSLGSIWQRSYLTLRAPQRIMKQPTVTKMAPCKRFGSWIMPRWQIHTVEEEERPSLLCRQCWKLHQYDQHHPQVTFCVRTMALTFTNPVDAAFAYSLYFGTLLPVDLIIKSSSTTP